MKKKLTVLIVMILLLFSSCATTEEYKFELDPWYWGEWSFTSLESQVRDYGVFPYSIYITMNNQNEYTFKIGDEEYSGEYEYNSERGMNVKEEGYFTFNNNPPEYQKMYVVPDWGKGHESLYWSEYNNDYMWVENYYINPDKAHFWFEGYEYNFLTKIYNAAKFN